MKKQIYPHSLISKLFLIVFFIFSNLLNAQNFDWAKQFEGSGKGSARDIALDDQKNVYTVGNASGIVDLDPGSGVFNLGYTNSKLAFISKLDTDGNFLWAKGIIDTTNTANFFLNFIESFSGSIYITGSFIGTIDFDPGPGVFYMTSTNQTYYANLFVLKLDSDGNFQWVKQYEASSGSGYGDIYDLCPPEIDGDGNIIIAAAFDGGIDFDPGPGVFNMNSGGFFHDLFITKLDSNGNLLWVKQFTQGGFNDFKSLALDKHGNIYAVGDFDHTMDFDPGSGVFSMSSSGIDIFMLSLDAGGNFLGALKLDCSSASFGNTINLDSLGYLYISGYFEGTLDADPGSNTYYLNALATNIYTGFICKYDVSGNLIWAKTTETVNYNLWVPYLNVDKWGNIYYVGNFSGTIDFDLDSTVYHMSATSSIDVFISKLDSSGSFVWAKQLSSVKDTVSVYPIQVDNEGGVYISGHFGGTIDFDPGLGVYNMSTASFYDQYNGYVLKLSPNCTTYSFLSITSEEEYTSPSGNYVWNNTGVYMDMIPNAAGCDSIITIDLTILNTSKDILVPNVITPNGDQLNDVLVIQDIEEYPNNHLVIFNRWGNKLFETTNYENNWSGEGVADGTYFYVLQLNDVDNTLYKGAINIFK